MAADFETNGDDAQSSPSVPPAGQVEALAPHQTDPANTLATGLALSRSGEGTRLKKWDAEEAELMAMLGVEKLLPQRFMPGEWSHYTKRITAGDEQAKQELVMRRLRYAYGEAKTFSKRIGSNELTVEDHFQHAITGIYKAVHSFKPEGAVSLEDHITSHTLQAMQREMAAYRLIYLPFDVAEHMTKIGNAKKKLGLTATQATVQTEIIAEPDLTTEQIAAIAEETGLTIGRVEKIAKWQSTVTYEQLLSLDARDVDVADPVEPLPEEIVEELIESEYLIEALERLTWKERRAVELRHGISGEQPHRYKAAGRALWTTEREARKREARGLNNLEDLALAGQLRLSSNRQADRGKINPNAEELLKRRKQEEELARILQLERDKQALKKLVASKYKGGQETATEAEILRGGLAEIILETVHELAQEDPTISYSVPRLRARLRVPPWARTLVDVRDFVSSLDLLAAQGTIYYPHRTEDGRQNHANNVLLTPTSLRHRPASDNFS